VKIQYSNLARKHPRQNPSAQNLAPDSCRH